MDSPLTTEPETRRFLAEFVRYSRPQIVVETGCHDGETALEIGEVLDKQGGTLYTCDTESVYVTMTRNKVSHLPVIVEHCRGVELIDSLPKIDMAFLDSGADLERAREAQQLFHRISGWCFLHDALQKQDPCFDKIVSQGWKSVLLPYGRGLGMFWK